MYRLDKFKKTVFGRGYIGDGVNSSRYGRGLPKTKKYLTWFAMMQRCYSENSLKRKPTYENCSVDERWWNFQVFCDWYDENFYQIDDCVMCLDKDILVKNNKVYSPETCIFVPQQINKLLTLRQLHRGELPLGVHKNRNSYSAFCNKNGKSVYIGNFDTAEKALHAYIKEKEVTLKESAEKYIKCIPYILYKALYNYKIDIDDCL